MTQFFNNRPGSKKIRELRVVDDTTRSRKSADSGAVENPYPGMTLIPWRDIWASLTIAKMRGNGQMIEVFYDTLFKDAVFDDRGAWSLDVKKRN